MNRGVASRPALGLAHSSWDALLLAAALAQGVALSVWAPLDPFAQPGRAIAWGLAFAVSVWWGSNTVSHNHLHNPLFRSRAANRGLSLYLTLLLAIPQTLWRRRHLHHHAGLAASERASRPGPRVLREAALVAGLWGLLLYAAPPFLLLVYLPAWGLGLALCSLQGHYEHLGAPAGVSHRGRLHNLLWFNDGFHAEHHRWPRMHWAQLPAHPLRDAACNPHPPVLRWLGAARPHLLCALERLALRSPTLQRLLILAHARAFRSVLDGRTPRHVLVVGGGLFPRSLLVLRQVLPGAAITVMDTSAEHLATARAHLLERGVPLDCVTFRQGRYEPDRAPWSDPAQGAEWTQGVELVVLPLALEGDRAAAFEAGPVPRLLHAWLWEPAGSATAVVSRLLLKRVSLV